MIKAAFLFISFQFVIICASFKITCLDEDNNFVDWYYLYKLPSNFQGLNNETESNRKGLNYLFLSSNNFEKGWQLSTRLINENESFPGRTITAVSSLDNILLLAYNDEFPNGTVHNNGGHTKGIVAANEETGFWLIHSVPKYPDIENSSYNYPWTGLHYGQSFLCISLNASQIDNVGKQLIFNEPNVYYSKITENLREKYPNFGEVLERKWRTEAPFWNDLELITINQTSFRTFAKGHSFNKELYEDYVAPALNEDLLVETWRHGPGNFPSNCTKHNRIYNISSLKLTSVNINFNSTLDHSKWAVSEKEAAKWICIGDINRAQHQLSRGGGTVCQLNTVIAEVYRKLVNSIESCPN